jgi:hypothetical protein
MNDISDLPGRDICKTAPIKGTITYVCLASDKLRCPYALNYEGACYCLHSDSYIFAFKEPNPIDN